MRISSIFVALALLLPCAFAQQQGHAVQRRDDSQHHHHGHRGRGKTCKTKNKPNAGTQGGYAPGVNGGGALTPDTNHGSGASSPPGSDYGSGGTPPDSKGSSHSGQPPASPPSSYDTGPSAPAQPDADGQNFITVRGIKGTDGSLPSNYDLSQFSPNKLHRGRGTQFGDMTYDNTGPWKGGACMYDDLPHKNLPSVAMNQLNFLDGLACGSCVEIWNTPPNAFKPGVHWQLEPTQDIHTKPPGNTTLAFVSDLCPGLDQCYTGLDSHYDTWNSYTGLTGGTELQIQWRFVSCQKLFHRTGAGGEALQVHWRDGSNEGYCNVQIRGSFQPVVKVEAQKQGGGAWLPTTHRDSSYWAIEDCGKGAEFRFRLTDWQGNTIETEQGKFAPINTHVKISDANFD